ncbi:hypothetical protein BCR37DRAFT_375885 [Protomyces lactucae-debilis]|uniref:Uncharacterized protein n=1 Tax=Protomyces lactucae-debilis TaxID=2754530 RepID=A0A1Y2FXA0_PROLT|nr:uncharacterized protein BCR37DRAFT_375885 [Protomyces lactucae-debilis]ORY87924.1 hypothetical protein BCR37DRAFT_375885 [Protomyces lactucae-debilis]
MSRPATASSVPAASGSDRVSRPGSSQIVRVPHLACTDACLVDQARAQAWTLDDYARLLYGLRDHLKDRINELPFAAIASKLGHCEHIAKTRYVRLRFVLNNIGKWGDVLATVQQLALAKQRKPNSASSSITHEQLAARVREYAPEVENLDARYYELKKAQSIQVRERQGTSASPVKQQAVGMPAPSTITPVQMASLTTPQPVTGTIAISQTPAQHVETPLNDSQALDAPPSRPITPSKADAADGKHMPMISELEIDPAEEDVVDATNGTALDDAPIPDAPITQEAMSQDDLQALAAPVSLVAPEVAAPEVAATELAATDVTMSDESLLTVEPTRMADATQPAELGKKDSVVPDQPHASNITSPESSRDDVLQSQLPLQHSVATTTPATLSTDALGFQIQAPAATESASVPGETPADPQSMSKGSPRNGTPQVAPKASSRQSSPGKTRKRSEIPSDAQIIDVDSAPNKPDDHTVLALQDVQAMPADQLMTWSDPDLLGLIDFISYIAVTPHVCSWSRERLSTAAGSAIKNRSADDVFTAGRAFLDRMRPARPREKDALALALKKLRFILEAELADACAAKQRIEMAMSQGRILPQEWPNTAQTSIFPPWQSATPASDAPVQQSGMIANAAKLNGAPRSAHPSSSVNQGKTHSTDGTPLQTQPKPARSVVRVAEAPNKQVQQRQEAAIRPASGVRMPPRADAGSGSYEPMPEQLHRQAQQVRYQQMQQQQWQVQQQQQQLLQQFYQAPQGSPQLQRSPSLNQFPRSQTASSSGHDFNSAPLMHNRALPSSIAGPGSPAESMAYFPMPSCTIDAARLRISALEQQCHSIEERVRQELVSKPAADPGVRSQVKAFRQLLSSLRSELDKFNEQMRLLHLPTVSSPYLASLQRRGFPPNFVSQEQANAQMLSTMLVPQSHSRPHPQSMQTQQSQTIQAPQQSTRRSNSYDNASQLHTLASAQFAAPQKFAQNDLQRKNTANSNAAEPSPSPLRSMFSPSMPPQGFATPEVPTQQIPPPPRMYSQTWYRLHDLILKYETLQNEELERAGMSAADRMAHIASQRLYAKAGIPAEWLMAYWEQVYSMSDLEVQNLFSRQTLATGSTDLSSGATTAGTWQGAAAMSTAPPLFRSVQIGWQAPPESGSAQLQSLPSSSAPTTPQLSTANAPLGQANSTLATSSRPSTSASQMAPPPASVAQAAPMPPSGASNHPISMPATSTDTAPNGVKMSTSLQQRVADLRAQLTESQMALDNVQRKASAETQSNRQETTGQRADLPQKRPLSDAMQSAEKKRKESPRLPPVFPSHVVETRSPAVSPVASPVVVQTPWQAASAEAAVAVPTPVVPVSPAVHPKDPIEASVKTEVAMDAVQQPSPVSQIGALPKPSADITPLKKFLELQVPLEEIEESFEICREASTEVERQYAVSALHDFLWMLPEFSEEARRHATGVRIYLKHRRVQAALLARLLRQEEGDNTGPTLRKLVEEEKGWRQLFQLYGTLPQPSST